MKKIQTSTKTMRAVDEKLVFNKCWLRDGLSHSTLQKANKHGEMRSHSIPKSYTF